MSRPLPPSTQASSQPQAAVVAAVVVEHLARMERVELEAAREALQLLVVVAPAALGQDSQAPGSVVEKVATAAERAALESMPTLLLVAPAPIWEPAEMVLQILEAQGVP
jgi:hypothetical protein